MSDSSQIHCKKPSISQSKNWTILMLFIAKAPGGLQSATLNPDAPACDLHRHWNACILGLYLTKEHNYVLGRTDRRFI